MGRHHLRFACALVLNFLRVLTGELLLELAHQGGCLLLLLGLLQARPGELQGDRRKRGQPRAAQPDSQGHSLESYFEYFRATVPWPVRVR